MLFSQNNKKDGKKNFDWSNKRLVILGATRLYVEIIEVARRNGAYTIVLDWKEDSPAKKYADEAQLISITDVDAVVDFIKNNNIDGVFTSFNDMLLPYYVQIAEKTGLPCLINMEQANLANDKSLFKSFCRKYNVPTIPEFSDYSNLEFPVLVKPVDNSGSRGISTCYNYDEFEKAKNHALENSKKKEIIVEKFLECEEITISYTMQDGEILLTSIHDRFFNTEQIGVNKVPNCYIYPSKYLDRYIKEVNDKVINMLKALNFKDGKIWFQCFVDENNFYLYEPGVRLNGCKIYNVINQMCDYNELERMINYSLTGSMGNPSITECANPLFKEYAVTLSYLAAPGKIGRIEGVEAVNNMPETIHSTVWYNEGDTVEESSKGTLLQTVLRISLYSKTISGLIRAIEKVNNTYKVYDINNQNMLLTPYNPEELRKIYSEETLYAKA